MLRDRRVIHAGTILAWLLGQALYPRYNLVRAQKTPRNDSRQLLVITSHEIEPFQRAIAGIKSKLTTQAPLTVMALKGKKQHLSSQLTPTRLARVRLILTLGSLATREMQQVKTDSPHVACLVLHARDIRALKQATGVYLEHPLSTHLHYLQLLLPSARTIGLLYSLPENGPWVKRAERFISQQGRLLTARAISSRQEIPTTLDLFANRIEVLWGIPDNLVLNPQTARQVLLFSFRNRIPFIGPSAAWVKAGALYALDWDYFDLGQQCAEMAQKILAGQRPESITPEMPRKVTYHLNGKTAAHLKLRLAPAIYRGAAHVY